MMTVVAGIVVGLATLVGLALTLLTLSGAWLIVLAAAGSWCFIDGLYSWPTMLIAVGLAACGDIVEIASSAIGVKAQGGGRAAASLSVVGAILGAVLGSVFIPVPVLGTVTGAVVGAAGGAVAGERGVAEANWRQTARVGTGAAAGRLISVIAKTVLTACCGGLLTVAAFV